MKEKINSFALCSMSVSLSLSMFWGILTTYMFYKSNTSSIISLLIGYIINILLTKIILLFYNYQSDKSLIEKFKNIFPKIYKLVSLLFISLSILLFSLITYRLSSFLSNEYLTETNELYFFILSFIVILNLTNKNIETISRVSTIILYLSSILFFSICILLLKDINLNNYLPLLTTNTNNIIISSIVYSVYFSIPNIFIYTIKKDNITDKNKLDKMFYKFNIYSFLITFLSIAITLGVYGINLSKLFSYPLYSVLKKIKIFSFLDSIENFSVILWIFYTTISASVILLSIFNNTKEIFKNNNYSNIIITSIIFIIAIILHKNNSILETYNYTYIPFIILLLLFIIIFISLIISKIKKY